MNMMDRSERVHNVPVSGAVFTARAQGTSRGVCDRFSRGYQRGRYPQETPHDDDGLSYEWTEEEVALAYRESSPTMQVILDYLADHAEDWVPAPELARVAYPQESNGVEDRLYGAFGGMGRRFHNQYRKHWFFDYGRERNPDGSWGSMRYRMSPERAAWLKKASGRE
jgi:hypothetical protein